MNGFSLLLVIATVGATARMETDAAGQAAYTIHIESVLIEQLRQGQVVEMAVGLAERRAKRFRVVLDPPPRGSSYPARTDGASRSESLVEYEAVPMDNGETEMWVQMSPERLETLASRPIEGQVPAEVQQIHRYKIFVGVNDLPRQQTATATNDSRTPFLLANDGSLSQAGATADANRRPAAAPSKPGTFSGSTPTYGNYGSNATAPPLANTRTTDTRNSWRNGPDQSTVSPPPLYGGAPTYGNETQYTTPTNTRYNDQYAAPAYGNPTAPTFNDRNNQYTYGGANPYPQSNLLPAQPTQQAPPLYNQNQYAAAPGYGQPQATVAARPDTQYVQPTTAANNWNQPAANTGITATAQPAAPTVAAAPAVTTAAAASSTKSNDDSPKTSTPLILTTLALFTSLGVNAYLGWLAWSFFWRYRDAMNDSARARSHNSPNRQAA